MNYINFSRWIEEKINPNLLPNSTVVIVDASYHTKQVYKSQLKSALKKEDLVDWLACHDKDLPQNPRKADLFEEIKSDGVSRKMYIVYSILMRNEQEVICLPSYMCNTKPYWIGLE